MSKQSALSAQHHCMVVFAHYPAGETRVQRQAESLVKNGFAVDVLCLRGMYNKKEPVVDILNGVNVYRLPVTRRYGNIGFIQQFLEYLVFFFQSMLVLIWLYPRRRYKVIQVHNLPDFLIFAAWFPKLFGAKLILDLHDLMPEFFASRTGSNMGSWLVRLITWQEQLACRFSDHIITVTELWRQTLIGRGLQAEKVSVVMNVADDSIFNRYANQRSLSENGAFRLFYHGGWVQRYGIDLVLQAMAQLKNEIPELSFTIHGGGSYKESLFQLVDRLGLQQQVEFSTKYRRVSDLPELICQADVAVVPNRADVFTDGVLPTKLMEYTALGVPAIVARTSAIEAYFDDSMVEFFEPDNVQTLANSISTLYHNRSRLKALIKNSDKFNQQYNWTKQQVDYVALLKNLS